MSLYRVRIVRDENTQEEISRDILDISNETFYSTNITEEAQLPDETLEYPNKILLKPNIDIQFGDWILKDGLEFKIKKINKIIYNGVQYLIKVEY
jgi:hypothetical protein